ncbi:MAG: GTP 3',8-cyclase MoaA [Marinilabiliales bacterium]
MPSEGIKQIPHSEILSFEEIVEVVKYAVSRGIDKIRITGGEPLVRKGIVELVEMLSEIEGIKELTMTSNGILLADYAQKLKQAGLNRINISLDTIDPDKYKKITRGGDIKDAIKGIVAAQKAGLCPVKINCVVKENSNEPDAIGVKEFCNKMNIQVRFIHLMDLNHGYFSVIEGGTGGNCAKCNRLRLNARGDIMPCLFSDIAYNIRKLGIPEAFRLALENKPKAGTKSQTHMFYNTGG